jgi:hypothetical protein
MNYDLTEKDLVEEKFEQEAIAKTCPRKIIKALNGFMIQVLIDTKIFLLILYMID